MPADYISTAKALALPISPLESPSPSSQSNRPPWSRRLSAPIRHNSSPYSLRTAPLSYKDQILRSADKVQRKIVSTFQKLSLFYKILVIIAAIVSLTLGILFLIFSERIFGMLAPVAEKWRDIKGGWMILWALTFICAFPPLSKTSQLITFTPPSTNHSVYIPSISSNLSQIHQKPHSFLSRHFN
jgi:hypothetical protein